MSKHSELLKPCPECNSEDVEPVEVTLLAVDGAKWQVICKACGYEGAVRKSMKVAMKRWNEVGW